MTTDEITERAGRRAELRPSDCINLAGTETGRDTISHSKSSLWLACHRKFGLHYVDRLELIRRPRYFTLGTAYQKALEYQDPEVGVRFLNGFEPCAPCEGTGLLPTGGAATNADTFELTLEREPCEGCEGRGYVGEQVLFYDESAEAEHRVNEAIVRGASTLYLSRWPAATSETREFEFRVRLRSPWTGAYSNTFDLLGYADGLIDPHASVGLPLAAPEGMFAGAMPFEIIENKLVGRVDRLMVAKLPLDRQLALERYGVWRATGRTVEKVYYRWVKKPSIKQRGGRKADKSDAESFEAFLERIEFDYSDRPEFYAIEEEPKFTTTGDLLRVEADLWEWAEDMRARMRKGSDGRTRVFDRNTDHCVSYGGCQFMPICTGDPDAMSLYRRRPHRAELTDTVPEADAA